MNQSPAFPKGTRVKILKTGARAFIEDSTWTEHGWKYLVGIKGGYVWMFANQFSGIE